MNRAIVFYSLIFLFLSFNISCKNKNNQNAEQPLSADIIKNPNTANGVSDTSSLPIFSFNEETHDFGRIYQGEKVTYSFKFKNVGKSDLIITDAKGSCGCAVADYPKTPVKPGNEATIDVKFNTEGKKGFQSKTITLISNTQPNTKVLTIKAQIQVPEGSEDN